MARGDLNKELKEWKTPNAEGKKQTGLKIELQDGFTFRGEGTDRKLFIDGGGDSNVRIHFPFTYGSHNINLRAYYYDKDAKESTTRGPVTETAWATGKLNGKATEPKSITKPMVIRDKPVNTVMFKFFPIALKYWDANDILEVSPSVYLVRMYKINDEGDKESVDFIHLPEEPDPAANPPEDQVTWETREEDTIKTVKIGK